MTGKQKEILEAYKIVNEDDIFTERILAMIRDFTGADIDENVEVLALSVYNDSSFTE